MRERRVRSVAGLSLLSALVAVPIGLPAATGYADEPVPDGPDAVVALVNEERESAGCGTVNVDDRLGAAAQGHSQDQADRGELTHIGADGSTVGERVSRAGYEWSSVAENVAYGTRSAEEAMAMWMESSAHRQNILDCGYVHIGVAEVDGYWTQTFGRPG